MHLIENDPLATDILYTFDKLTAESLFLFYHDHTDIGWLPYTRFNEYNCQKILKRLGYPNIKFGDSCNSTHYTNIGENDTIYVSRKRGFPNSTLYHELGHLIHNPRVFKSGSRSLEEAEFCAAKYELNCADKLDDKKAGQFSVMMQFCGMIYCQLLPKLTKECERTEHMVASIMLTQDKHYRRVANRFININTLDRARDLFIESALKIKGDLIY